MKLKPLLETERLILRLAGQGDLPAILQFYKDNRAHFTPWWPLWSEDFFTEEYWSRRIQSEISQFEQGAAIRLHVFPKHDESCVVGLVGFSSIVRGAAQFCNLGYGLDFRELGKGLMTEAVLAATQYVFSDWNLHRVQANYMPRNEASGAVLKKVGFVEEGRAHGYLRINGVWEDHILTSLTNPHWSHEEVEKS